MGSCRDMSKAHNNTMKGSPQKDVGLDAQKARPLFLALSGKYEIERATSLSTY